MRSTGWEGLRVQPGIIPATADGDPESSPKLATKLARVPSLASAQASMLVHRELRKPAHAWPRPLQESLTRVPPPNLPTIWHAPVASSAGQKKMEG
eukprot:1867049-Alexandrium_andersonii.AAC.1